LRRFEPKSGLMNKNIHKLHKIASKKSRWIVGLMSGTSLDGLDVAVCKFTGSGLSTKLEVKNFRTVPYAPSEKNAIKKIFAKSQVSFLDVCLLNSRLALLHAEMVNACLKKWRIKNEAIDCIASHGQTVFHAPAFLHPDDPIHTTLQIGDGDHLARKTGVMTISDFRQKHIAAGGEGAPLAVYGDYLLFSKRGRNRILLNLGGIGNFTYLPGTAKASEVFVTDTGPANTLLDQYTQNYFPNLFFDKDSKIAKSGTCHEKLLAGLLNDTFFDLPFPKTTGPELFNLDYLKKKQQASGKKNISHEDVMATLTHFSAQSIANAMLKTIGKKKDVEIYVSGGGAHNPLLMELLRQKLIHYPILPMTNLGIDGDAKEAVLFATLANEALAGGKIDFGKRSKIPSVSFGKISFPN